MRKIVPELLRRGRSAPHDRSFFGLALMNTLWLFVGGENVKNKLPKA
ncbi:hypothetical protein ACSFA8_05310 [Variovorax sp. RT4R15]